MKKSKKLLAIIAAVSLTYTLSSFSVCAKANDNSSVIAQDQQMLNQHKGQLDQLYNSFSPENTKVIRDYKNKKGVQYFKTSNLSKSSTSFGEYPTRTGVILVTKGKSILGAHVGHAGIVLTASTTVESENVGGVQRLPNTWKSRYSTVKGITVKGTTDTQDEAAAQWCDKQVGKPYNWDFFNINTRDKFYCSQLVWASYKDLYGIDIDSKKTIDHVILPLDLPNQDNVDTIYAQW